MRASIASVTLLEVITMPATPPGGSNHQLQYNNNGTFGGIAGTTNNTNGAVGIPTLETTTQSFSQVTQVTGGYVNSVPAIIVALLGSPGAIGGVVCQPFLRDTGSGTTLGTVIGWTNAYDASGVLIGKMPIYDNIT